MQRQSVNKPNATRESERGPRRHDLPLSDYALIGDGRTAALVARDGSIDWLCYERFDGPAVFCRILDVERGGYFQVVPDVEFRSSRRYVGHTNVLETEFQCDGGSLRVTDCMPLDMQSAPVLLRKLEGLSGEVPLRVQFHPTFDFARARTVVEVVAGGCSATSGEAAMRLGCPEPMTLEAGGATSVLRLEAGQTRWVVLTHADSPVTSQVADEALNGTLRAWEAWSSQGRYPQPYSDLVRRSALVSKLLIHGQTGAMVAAPTTSLPEVLGGSRNWDYRFTWLRDASWLVSALMDLGYHDESMAFIAWLETLDFGHGAPSVLYDIDGKVPGDEQEIPHLRGYRNSRPVRVGNSVTRQSQHDVFGEVIAAIHTCSETMPSMRPLRPGLRELVVLLADQAVERWQHPDHGMWEIRDTQRHFLSSRLLCWAALDSALSMAQRDGFSHPAKRWRDARRKIRRSILEQGFDPVIGFKRALDDAQPDATALLLPRYGFLDANDPRMVRTVEVVQQRLGVGDGLLRRYLAPDGLAGVEGAFVACSFWLADCLARQGEIDGACRVFEDVTRHANDVGLLSEEIDPSSGALLGNFPQAFSHLGLVRAATSIAQAMQRRP